ncbi:hypothetical protein OG21DRAFT_1514584 [Imleria badia]|nr:hypothetical protein OG21DRAFT_1514584 [Imleria badia]
MSTARTGLCQSICHRVRDSFRMVIFRAGPSRQLKQDILGTKEDGPQSHSWSTPRTARWTTSRYKRRPIRWVKNHPSYILRFDIHRNVPTGYLPIEIVRLPEVDWAIYIPTGHHGVGFFYQIGGNSKTGYVAQHVINERHPRWEDRQGSHVVGWVDPYYLWELKKYFCSVPIEQGAFQCGKHWVVEALRGLDVTHTFVVALDYEQLDKQMPIAPNRKHTAGWPQIIQPKFERITIKARIYGLEN